MRGVILQMVAGKRKSMVLLAAAIMLLLSTALAGCSNGGNAPEQKNAEANEASAEKVVTLSWPRDIGPMNPHVYNPSQLIGQSMIFEPLVNYGEGGKLEPALAESWTISEDGKEYTFKIREGVKFSDGSAFNATIVKKNFDAIMKNVDNHSWLGFIALLEKTEAVDEYTFKMNLREAYYPTIQELSVVRPVRFLGEAGFPDDGDTSKGVKASIGTGPWMLSDYKTDEYATFTRNPNYWGEQPKVDKIVIKIIPDGDTRVLAFEKGELDLIYGEGIISLDAYKQLEESGEYETKLSEPVATRQLILNTANAALADLNVRLALQAGFNKQAMVDGVTSGFEEKADNLLSTNLPYTNITVSPIPYDVEKAKSYLDEAGWKLPEGKTVREKDGKPLELELIYEKAEQIQKPMAETLQAEWAAIGIKLNITGLDLTEQIKRFRANDFDLNFFSNYGSPYDPHSFIQITAEKGFGIAEALAKLPMKAQLDQQIHDALGSTDEKKREELYGSILTTLQEQAAIVPISYVKKMVVANKKLGGVEFPANRDANAFSSLQINE